MIENVSFRLAVGDNVRDVVVIMIGEMQRRGIQVSEISGTGTFSIPVPNGVIAGSFAIAGNSLVVSIAQRPEAVSDGMIESKLQDFILDAKAELKNRRQLPKPG
ncbi:MAG: hypothetical protein WCJ09_23820 [Planctomycetota bacterium]